MYKETAFRRSDEDLFKVIKNQRKGFEKLHEILRGKNKKIFELNKEIISLKYKIKCLEIEIRRLRND